MKSQFFLALGMAALLASPALAQDSTGSGATGTPSAMGNGDMTASSAPAAKEETVPASDPVKKTMVGGKHNRRSRHHDLQKSRRQTENTPTH